MDLLCRVHPCEQPVGFDHQSARCHSLGAQPLGGADVLGQGVAGSPH